MSLTDLVLVACHAVYTADNFDDPLSDSSWFLQEFQTGEPPYYVEHIGRGVELTANNPQALLVFSGGQTRLAAGPRSEAQSYWMLAEHFRWWSHEEVQARTTTEEFGRDSFENVLFGLCRFREYVGAYPDRMTVVSWAFKEKRFELHRQAARFPAGRFVFVGANNPADLPAAMAGEEKNGIRLFAQDPYGFTGALAEKRRARNPFHRQHGYGKSCPEVAELLEYGGPEWYGGKLPWD